MFQVKHVAVGAAVEVFVGMVQAERLFRGRQRLSPLLEKLTL
jgi:hypothetical protein